MRIEADYPNAPDSVTAARRLVGEVLARSTSAVRDRVRLMTSEIVTNAVVHARGGFRLVIDLDEAAVRVHVWDADEGVPMPRDPSPADVNGRGLLIVQALADSWGVDEQPDGKIVWFAVELTRDESPAVLS